MEEQKILLKTVNSNGIYSCNELDITVEEWKKVLQDSSVYDNYKLWLARFFQEPNYKASCKFMGTKYSCSPQTPNSLITNFGKTTQKILNRFEVRDTDGEKSYWVIPMKEGKSVNGAFEWTMRDELVQAMEELNMTDPEKFEEKKFTWIPFYSEMAEKLLEYKDNREDLVKIIFGMDRQYINYIKDDNGNDYPDIDPFSVFAIFNRGITEIKRKNICKYFKEKLGINAEIPNDFNSIPVMNPKLSVFVGRNDIDVGIQPIWDLFIEVLSKNMEYNKFYSLFNIVRNQRGIKWTLTMALFWIRPYDFMPLDTPSREYLNKIGIEVFDEKNYNGENYVTLLNEIKTKIENNEIKEKSFLEISYNAWLKDVTSQGESQMQNDQEKLINETKTLLENTKNLILTGAPGTGKTFLAKQIAKAMGCSENEIGFVQFHPSYDYTDFVEGLRPVQNDGSNQIGFERKDGVFKEFCKQALLSNTITENSLLSGLNKNPTVWKVSLQGTGDNPVRKDCLENNYIRIGWSEYGNVENFDEFDNFEKGGKYILRNYQSEMKIGDIILSCYSAKEIDAIGIVTGDYEYREEGKNYPRYRTVTWLIKNIKENIVEMNGGKTFTLSTIYKASISIQDVKTILEKYITPVNKNVTSKQKKFVFIIDEINRGEVSKIFGELFYCIDPGYRGEKGRISTQYQNLVTSGEFQKGFFIPENVYIIGTMNDIDRSVESMDFAFRRRFAWKEITADNTQYMLDEVEKDGVIYGLPSEIVDEAKDRMNRLNNKISELPDFNSAYHIGASYFLKLNQLDGDFESLWNYHLKGILEEYLRGNPEKDKYMTQLKNAYDEEDVTNE